MQQNALGVLRNISDAAEGQEAILTSRGVPLLLGTIRQHSAYDEIIELGLECLLNVSSVGVQNSMVLLLDPEPCPYPYAYPYP